VQDPDRDHTQPRQIGESAWQEIGFTLDLSPRELQVARCIWHGQHNKEIAIALRLSARSIHTYVERIYLKLRLHGRAELTGAISDAERGLPRGRPPERRPMRSRLP
jgi:DNA-binding NarL/FixJ family response regulator